jgi:hypothetical protein
VHARRELPEVFCGFGDGIVVQFEHDSLRRSRGVGTDSEVKLWGREGKKGEDACEMG